MGARVALSLKTACDYRKFRPCLNQDLCGTLITDLFEAAPRSRRTWSLLPCPVDECILAQGVRVAKQSGFGSAYFGGIDQGEAAFPLEEGKRRRRRLAPAKPKFQPTVEARFEVKILKMCGLARAATWFSFICVLM